MYDDGLETFLAVRQHTIELIRPPSQQELDRIHAPGKWSPGEVVDHIILAGEAFQRELEELIRLKRSGQRPFLRRTFSDFDLAPAFVPKEFLPLLEIPFSLFSSFLPHSLRDYLVRNRLIPFRAATAGTPRYGLPAADLRSRLLASFESFKSVYESNADLDFRELVFQHTVLGYFNMVDIIFFVIDHERRHQKQIADTLARI